MAKKPSLARRLWTKHVTGPLEEMYARIDDHIAALPTPGASVDVFAAPRKKRRESHAKAA